MINETQPLSESVETYLENILRLGAGNEPVPLSQLADSMGVSPISVNQMCRKLQDQGLVDYVPYKGVSFTPAGKRQAMRVLRCHRLWEVFLVDHLQMPLGTAYEAACRLEHSTSDEVIQRLDEFLGHPHVSPEGEPIPPDTGDLVLAPQRTLAQIEIGQEVTCVRPPDDPAIQVFLAGQGLRPGATLKVLAQAPEGILVQVGERQMALERVLAERVLVEAPEHKSTQPDPSFTLTQSPLNRLVKGQRGVVVRVGGNPRLRMRLLEMGLVPGETVVVRSVAPFGDPIEFTIKGYHLSLRREEAALVLVEVKGQNAQKAVG